MRILLTEDDEGLRGFVGRALEHDGHIVDPAGDGMEALAALDARRGKFDLLFSDIRMPLMDGFALARSAAGRWPRLPVLLMTGYADENQTHVEVVPKSVRGVLAKPFSLADMREAVDAAFAADVCGTGSDSHGDAGLPGNDDPACAPSSDGPVRDGVVRMAAAAVYSVLNSRSR